MLRFFMNLFSVPPGGASRKAREMRMINLLVRRFSRGNTRLQEGRYLTKEDVERLRSSALRCRF
jgi:hypothetical protein